MRRALLELLRATHLIELADKTMALRASLRAGGENRAYRAAHPSRPFPDPLLIYEVAGHAKFAQFDRTGAAHARLIAEYLREVLPASAPRVLEWGCGPARILAHLGEALGAPDARLFGCDPDPRAVDYARAAYPRIEFMHSPPLPPTSYAAASFDAIYGVSIFTHLPIAAARAWTAELARLTAPDGGVLVTTHGDKAAARLEGADRDAFDAGRYVALGGAPVGSRTYVSYFNEKAGRALFGVHFDDVRFYPDDGQGFGQDVWLLRRPHPAPGA